MNDPNYDRYEHNFNASMERAQAYYDNMTPETDDDETEDDIVTDPNDEEMDCD